MPVAIPSRRYFEALDLAPDIAGEEDIRAAYKKLALKWHPDRHTTDKDEAQQKFIEINEAYTILLEYYQHRRRGSPHPEKRQHREHSRPAPTASSEASASSHEHRGDDAQSSSTQSRHESDAHSTRSSTDTAFTTPPSSPKSTTRNKLHKARASQRGQDEDASGAGRTSSSSRSRSDLRDEGHSHSKQRHEGRGAEDANPRHHTHHNHDHHDHDHDHDNQSHRDTSAERHRSRDEGRRQQPSSRSRDNLRAQSPGRRHAQDSARPPPSPTAQSGSRHGSESYFTWPRKRQTRQRSDDSTTSQRRPGFFPKRSKLDLDPPGESGGSNNGGAAPSASTTSSGDGTAIDYDYDFLNLGTPIPPLRSPHLPSSDPRRDRDWTFPLALTLDDLYHARAHHYRITRTRRGGAPPEAVKLPIPVDPAWRHGTRVVVPGAGNERADGSFQDIVFVVEVAHHPRFGRAGDDLVAAVQVPWEDPPPPPSPSSSGLGQGEREGRGEQDLAYVQGMDGEEYALPIPRTLAEAREGTRIVGAGMPVVKAGRLVGKGDLLVRWEFVFREGEGAQPSRWQNLRKAMGRRIRA